MTSSVGHKMKLNMTRSFETDASPEECLERIRGAIQQNKSFRIRPTDASGAPFIGSVNGNSFTLRPNWSLTYYLYWRLVGRVERSEVKTTVQSEVSPPLSLWGVILIVLAVMAFVNDHANPHWPVHLVWITMWVFWISWMYKSASKLADKLKDVVEG